MKVSRLRRDQALVAIDQYSASLSSVAGDIWITVCFRLEKRANAQRHRSTSMWQSFVILFCEYVYFTFCFYVLSSVVSYFTVLL